MKSMLGAWRSLVSVLVIAAALLTCPGCETPESFATERQKVEALATTAESQAANDEANAAALDEKIALLTRAVHAIEEKIDAIGDDEARAALIAETSEAKKTTNDAIDAARAEADRLRADARAARATADEWRNRLASADAEVSGAAQKAQDGQSLIGSVGTIVPGAAGVTGILAIGYGLVRRMISLSNAVSMLKGTHRTAQRTVQSIDSAITTIRVFKPELEPAIKTLLDILKGNQSPEVKAFVDEAQGKGKAA